jgi:hypothetical protein
VTDLASKSDPPRVPNLFIIGAPKCGTTALYEYLRTHPNVFMSRIKEPHFLAADFPTYRTIQRRDQYLELFADASDQHSIIGEASVFYMLSSVAVGNILQLNPRAKLVIMLRNPIDMVYSLHSQYLHMFFEDESDFRKAWELQDARAAGEHLPQHVTESFHLQYREVGRLGSQVERVLRTVPGDQVKLIFFEDFRRAPRDSYRDLLAFLEVPDDGRTEFPAVNQSRTHRLEWLSRFLMHPPFPLSVVKRGLKSALNLHDTRVGLAIYQRNQVKRPRPPLTPEMRRVLAAEFRDDIRLLEEVSGRDLRHWLAE